jgi:hypothetical protein
MSAADLSVIFLLGAGSSLAAGMPSTQEVTDSVLSGERLAEALGEPGMMYADGIKDYLQLLRDVACAYFEKRGGRDPNYEDIYYLAVQVRDVCEGHFGNPLIYDVSNTILEDTARLEEQRRKCCHKKALALASRVLWYAVIYIEGTVRALMDRDPTGTDYLRLIADACRDPHVRAVHIVTLNHDRVIDTFLRQNDIQYADGFADETEAVDGFRRFCPEVYSRSGRVRVLKLHGGVDWTVRWSPDDPWDRQISIVVDPGARECLRPEGRVLDSLPIQVGTYNKIMDYTLARYLSDLQCQFLRSLDASDLMVISGYSFGDEGVNARVTHWVYARRGRRVVVIDPCLSNARTQLRSRWNIWQDHGVLFTVPRRIEDTSWEEVIGLARA